MRIQHDSSWRLTALAALAGLAIGLLGGGCASGSKPRRACLKLDASPNLHYYGGQAHVLTVYFYPLASALGFEQATVDDLLGGEMPPGVLAPPAFVTIRPGEEGRQFEDLFPNETTQIGVIAAYYRSPGDPEGTRKQVVPARCGWLRKPKLVFSTRDLYRK